MDKRKALVGLLRSRGEDATFADGYEDAIIGIGHQHTKAPVVLYDHKKVIEILMSQGMSHDEAVEFFDFNIGSAWVGDQTPMFVIMVDDVEYESGGSE